MRTRYRTTPGKHGRLKTHLTVLSDQQQGTLTIVTRGGQLEWCIERKVLFLGRKNVDVL